MSTDPQDIPTDVDLRDDGLLWMINTTIFHPRGLRLGVNTSTGKLSLMGDESEATIFSDELADRGFTNFNALLERHRAAVAGGRDG